MKLDVGQREVVKPGQRTNVSRPLGIGTVAPGQLSKLGGVLEKIGTEVALKVKAADETTEFSKLMTDAKGQMSTYYSGRSLEHDNFRTLADDTDKKLKEITAGMVKGVTGVEQQSRVRQGLMQIGVAYHSKAVGDATTQNIDAIKANHLSTRAAEIQQAGSGTDDELKTVIANYANSTGHLAQIGVFNADDAQKDVINFSSDVVRGAVRYKMNTDLDEAQRYLLDTEALSHLLDTEKRENLLAQTDRLMASRDRKAESDRKALEAEQDKMLNRQRDAIYQSSYREIISGTFTNEKLDQYMDANLLHKTDYEALYAANLNRNKDIVGSAIVHNGMKQRMYTGDLSVNEVISAVNMEQINWAWADEMIKGIESGTTIVKTDEYKVHLRSLKTALGWSPAMAGFSSPEQSQLISRAELEFWLRTKDGESIASVYDDMEERYIKQAQKRYPAPRYATVEEAKANMKPGKQLDMVLENLKWREMGAARENLYKIEQSEQQRKQGDE